MLYNLPLEELPMTSMSPNGRSLPCVLVAMRPSALETRTGALETKNEPCLGLCWVWSAWFCLLSALVCGVLGYGCSTVLISACHPPNNNVYGFVHERTGSSKITIVLDGEMNAVPGG